MPSAGIAAVLIGITLATVLYYFFPGSEEDPQTTSAHHSGRRSNSSNRYHEGEPSTYGDSWIRRRSHPYECRVPSGTCSICLELLTTDVQVVLNPCHHSFHEKCIMEWKAKSCQASCPNCRRRFT
ncbi:RING finger protein 122 [Lasioglossum baleicum]|uniref:RING finger protein 122 n=1 Tax=Lasioglossum baleicum TaxID=434251 RepID=UPI003FCDDAD5